jgi:diguanylate cyclase (GGDEF)-like protein
MLLDYTSLLLSIGFSAVCLSAILFAAWLTARTEAFLLTWAAGTACVVGNVFTYSVYVDAPSPTLGVIAFAFLLGGLSVLYGAARQFRLGRLPWRRTLIAGVLSLGIALPPIGIGYDGVGFALVNIAAAVLLAITAHEYWIGRHEAPSAITGIAALYLLVGISFALCGLVLSLDGRLVLDGPPSNWAEDLNLIIVIAGVPGIGAMSLALNQTRLARTHKREAMTDPLTGLLNRRALFDAHDSGALRGQMAVILFDIDRFKRINDEHGHATGDLVISLFAQALRESLGGGESAARLGGEEFALVLPKSSAEAALRHAEQVRSDFAALALHQGGLACTASAGIAFGEAHGSSFEAVLNAADQALYQAKRTGRDRIATAGLRLVEPSPRFRR